MFHAASVADLLFLKMPANKKGVFNERLLFSQYMKISYRLGSLNKRLGFLSLVFVSVDSLEVTYSFFLPLPLAL